MPTEIVVECCNDCAEPVTVIVAEVTVDDVDDSDGVGDLTPPQATSAANKTVTTTSPIHSRVRLLRSGTKKQPNRATTT